MTVETLATLASIYAICILITQLAADQSWKYSIFNQYNNEWLLRALYSPVMMVAKLIKGD